jgi:flagellar hook-length control protein FliK
MAAPAAPVMAAPVSPGGNAGNGPAPQIQVTVTQAPVQAQPAASLAAGSAVALQDQAAETPRPTPSADASGAAISRTGTGDGGAHRDANANANSGQSGFNNLPAGIVLPAAANAPGAVNGAATASFAAAIGEAAVDGIGEGTVSLGLPGSATTAAGARRASAAPSSPQLPRLSAMEQIAINVQKAVALGKDQVTIQLRPEELGRIDVRLEVGKDGQVSAQVRADRPETLDLLQRDARGLERVLQEAGLRADSGSLSFGLRGENSGNGQSADTHQSTANADPADDATEQAAMPALAHAADGRVDLHV